LTDVGCWSQSKQSKLYSYELAVRFLGRKFSGGVSAYDSEISNLIERRTLLLPQGSVGNGGQSAIIRQDATGADLHFLIELGSFCSHQCFKGSSARC
jgi:hypothetical protein